MTPRPPTRCAVLLASSPPRTRPNKAQKIVMTSTPGRTPPGGSLFHPLRTIATYNGFSKSRSPFSAQQGQSPRHATDAAVRSHQADDYGVAGSLI